MNYLITKRVFPIALIVLFSLLVSCEKITDEELISEEKIEEISPFKQKTALGYLAEFDFSISEDILNGDLVGKLVDIDTIERVTLSFSITKGNTNDAFIIDAASSDIYVNDAEQINHAQNPNFVLIVKVLKNGDKLGDCRVIINVEEGNIPDLPMEGVIAYYTMQGNSNDVSGNDYHLYNYGANLVADRNGNDNSAYSFDGNSGLTLGNQTVVDQSEPQSVSLWFKSESENNVEFGAVLFAVSGTSTAWNNSRFYVTIKGGYIWCQYGDGYDPIEGWNNILPSINKYDDDVWHNIVFISNGDNNTGLLYIDGDLENSMQFTKSNHNNISGLIMKVGGDKYQNYYTGEVDDVIYYGRALSAEEVLQIYNRG